MSGNNKTVIIGIDGAPFELMESLSDKGIMPNFKQLRGEGTFKKMRSSIPEVSSVAWSSIITGKNPGQHGIFGFTEIIPNTYSLAFPNFDWLKEPPFWQKNKNKKYVILNVPTTYPAKELNGVHVSGFISLDLEKAVYPSAYLPKLKEIDYQIDVDSELAHKSKSLFLAKLSETNEARIKAYKYFWEKENWDLFMLVFTGSDRLEHFLWDAYEEEDHQYHRDFLNYFKRVDEVIGDIAGRINKNDLILILSDHGMERTKTNFNVNFLLKKAGFLDTDESLKNYNQITSKTRAFALDPGRIYLNKVSKYPKGEVAENEEEKIIQELINLFNDIEKDGQRVIKKVYKKEEIYQGKEIDKAPDLVLVGNAGFKLRGSIEKKSLFEEDIFTGNHTLDNAFLYVNRRDSEKFLIPDNLNVEDVELILNKF
jgi:predicted AlkP superfamily phosphohydrolase/phosphomutase